jgi:hypothetical protein
MMTVTPYNICQGPADMYLAPFGTAEPADSTATVAAGPPPASWVGIGGTEVGVTVEVDVTYADIKVDQLIDMVGTRPTDRQITVKTQMKEATLANFNTAINSLLTVTPQASYTTADALTASSATQPAYTAVMIDGWAPTLASSQPARRRFIIRKCVSKPKVQFLYQKDKSAIYDVTFQAYYVSATTPIFHVVDQTA